MVALILCVVCDKMCSPWVNWMHALVWGPLLIYAGVSQSYSLVVGLGVLAVGVHVVLLLSRWDWTTMKGCGTCSGSSVTAKKTRRLSMFR